MKIKRKLNLPPRHVCGVALHEPLISDLLVTEGHRPKASVIARDTQPFFDPPIVVGRAL
jgi:hypothetical protein